MDFLDVIKNRHSVRSFSSKEVEEEKLQEILRVIDSAPSAGNLKSYRVVVVKDKEKKGLLSEAALNQTFVAEAPVTLVFLADKTTAASIQERRPGIIVAGQKYGKRGEELYSVQDATIAASYAQLAATNIGLSTVWVGAFHPEKVSKIIECKVTELPIAIIPLGYKKLINSTQTN